MGDQLEKYEHITRSNLSQNNKQLKQEIEAQREFEEALATRKSCLQILIIIVEFLSNAIIKNGYVVIELKKDSKNIKQVVMTNISASQHETLTQLIFNNQELLDVIYKQIIMRIPERD